MFSLVRAHDVQGRWKARQGRGAHPREQCGGGRNNAFTDQDFTAYFETLPKESFETALFIESERMRNSAFDPKEVESERQVIISEREGSENYPTYLLREELYAMSFRTHPYRWPVVGWKRDLKRMTRNDLYYHYVKYYDPSNATLVVCGNFNSKEAQNLISKYFGKIEQKRKRRRPQYTRSFFGGTRASWREDE